MAGLIMFIAALLMLGIGFPVAFTFGAVAMIFGMVGSVVESLSDGDGLLGSIEVFKDMFNFMPYRIFSIMESRICLLYTSPSPRDRSLSRMPSSA